MDNITDRKIDCTTIWHFSDGNRPYIFYHEVIQHTPGAMTLKTVGHNHNRYVLYLWWEWDFSVVRMTMGDS